MKIENSSVVRANVLYPKQSRVARKENNISFTSSSLGAKSIKKGLIALPLLTALTFTQKANAEQIQNDTTKIEVVSQSHKRAQQNTSNEEMNENFRISEFSPKVQKFIKDNNINTDGNDEISRWEIASLCDVAKKKASDHAKDLTAFNTSNEAVSYYYNVDDIALSVTKIANRRDNDKRLFNEQIKYMNNVIEKLDERYSINYNKDEQLDRIDNFANDIKNTYDKYVNTTKDRCIKVDDALFNLELSFQKPDASQVLKRDEYNYSYALWQKNIEKKFNGNSAYYKYTLSNIKNDIISDNHYLAYSRSAELRDEFIMERNSLKEEQSKIQNLCISKVQEYLNNYNNGELNEEQLNNIGKVFKVLADYKKGTDKDQIEINEYINKYDKMHETLGKFVYKPDIGKLMRMNKSLEDNYSNIEDTYNRTIKSYEKFDYEKNETLKDITESAKSERDTGLKRYSTMTETFESEIDNIRNICNDMISKQDKVYCNNILEQLTNVLMANDKSMRSLDIGAIEFLVDVVDVENPTTNAMSAKENTPITKSRKIVKDKKVVIETPVQDSNGKFVVRTNSLDGKPIDTNNN